MTAVLHYANRKQFMVARQMTETNGRELAAWCGGVYEHSRKGRDRAITFPLSLPNTGLTPGGWALFIGPGESLQLMSAKVFAETYIVDEEQGTFRHLSMRTTVWRVRKVLGRWRVNCPDGTYPCRCRYADTFEGAWREVCHELWKAGR